MVLLLCAACSPSVDSVEPGDAPLTADSLQADVGAPVERLGDGYEFPDVEPNPAWGYIVGGNCADSWQCTLYGFCQQDGDRCIAGTDADCARSAYCTLNGACARVGDWCGPTTDAHCAESKLCKVLGEGCTKMFECCGFCPGGPREPGPSDYNNLSSQLTWDTGIQSIVQDWCGGCHTGDNLTDCPGDSCLASYYEAAVAPSVHHLCPGETKLGCGLVRAALTMIPEHEEGLIVSDGRLLVLPPPLVDALRGWLERGAPK